ncbi:hypothetical protein CPB86DRAFT_751984 [Serendipita vermifera]|nr:hypothetical protein CPB86DRAFT_751984 [Serendipita vermifera]
MSFRKIASSIGKNREKNRESSAASTASWSPTNSRSHSPLTSSVSLPDTILPSNIQRYPSPTQSTNSRHSAGQNHNANSTPLRVVAPFVYNAPPAAYESTSSLASDEIRDPEKSSSLRIKRSLTKLLSSKEDISSNPYPKSTPRDSGKKKGKENGEVQKPRKGSFFGSSSSFFEEPTTKSSSRPPSIASTSSGAKKLVNWIGQSGVSRKVQDVLNRGGPSSHPSVSSSTKSRKSGEYGDEERDDASSISSTASFVQNAPEDDFSRIFPEPEPVPAMPLPNLQPPYQIPTAVYLPRSHTNLHALTLASLAFPPSPHPLLYNPSMPAFPRSSNPSSKLPRLPTFRAHLAKTRILDRLEAQDLTPSENESIIPFGRREDPSQKDPSTSNSASEGEGEEGKRTINDNPGSSVGLEAWTRRLPFSERIRVWKIDASYNGFGNSGDLLKYEPLAPSTPFRTELQISGGIKALAGLVAARPLSSDRELPKLPPEPVVLPEAPPTLTLGPITPLSQEALVIDESMLMENPQTPPVFTPNTVVIPLPAVPAALTSPRPLPIPPTRSAAEPVAQQKDWEDEEDNFSLVIPVRPLPPRPLPIPPSASSSSLDQIVVVDTPAVATTVVHASSPTQNIVHLSSSGHDHSQSGLLSSSSVTSAPQTPMDLLDTESIRRRSIGSISVVISNPGTVSLEEMDGLEATNPMDIDTRRRSTATLRMSIAQKRMSMASRKSRVSPMSSPSLRNHPLPPLTESFYSHSSRVSSHPTLMDSAGGSMEKLSHQKGPSTSSTSFEPPSESFDQFASGSSSPVIIESVNAIINDPKVEDQKSLEPSRISEEHVDPFFYPAGTSDPPQQKLVINGTSSPILSPAETERLFSSTSEVPTLTLSMNLPTPTAQKHDRLSADLYSAASPTSSMQSPSVSDSISSTDPEVLRSSTPPASVKFVKLKRTASQSTETVISKISSGSSSSSSGRLGRKLKDPSKFWPHNRAVDEKAEDEARADRDSTLGGNNLITTTPSYDRTSFALQRPIEESRPESGLSPSDTATLQSYPAVRNSALDEAKLEVTGNTSLPDTLAMHVARLSDVSKLDLTLYNPQQSSSAPQQYSPVLQQSSPILQQSPPVSPDEPRHSMSSVGSGMSAGLSSAAVKEMAVNMPVLPLSPANRAQALARHGRTPSSERAARIEAHLDSVSASKSRGRMGSKGRPDFLPYPGLSRERSGSLQHRSSEESLRQVEPESSNRMSQDGSEYSQIPPSEDSQPASPPLNGRFPGTQPVARWSETGWRDRQRTLNTLPLPSATIPHSATRQLPFGTPSGRGGLPYPSSTPSIFRQNPSQPGTIHGRPLRM